MISQIVEYNIESFKWKRINKSASNAIQTLWELSSELENQKAKGENRNQGHVGKTYGHDTSSQNRYHIGTVVNKLRFFADFSESIQARLSNSPLLVLSGVAGSGKTHLLCDLIEKRVMFEGQAPALLVFGEKFESEGDPLDQIIRQLGFNARKEDFLNSLDAAGRISKTRSIIAVDALNETRNIKYWKKNLKKLVKDVNEYPHISLIVSVRSGFENEVILKGVGKLFQKKEHRGFEFKEWEAVNAFFGEYDLPLPEIPVLTPEFQNPLFLLLFCKAFASRARKNTGKKAREIFRGHEGATYIFEAYVKKVTNTVAKKFGIPTGPHVNIWDTIIEKAAEKMVEANDDRVLEEDVIRFIEQAYPDVNADKLLLDLERNLLFVKLPKYSTQKESYDGFVYRFPFQKFSDHLIGRYLFRRFEKEFGKSGKNFETGKRFFSKRRKLGKYLANEWNLGIVEALSIQCPEYLKGIEFMDIAPYLRNTYVGNRAFLDSLIWRKPEAFTDSKQGTLYFINAIASESDQSHHDVLNTFLAVAQIPNHPFNADFLHRHLLKLSMAERDSWWSIFLHEEYENHRAVDRIVAWGWSEYEKSHVSDEGIRLCCIAIGWCLTTSNRFLRDKSTKALVALLTNRLGVLLRILEQFNNVDDLYVAERLYAVAYGCAVRSVKDKAGLRELAKWVYTQNFKYGNPPEHILLRDYAKGVIETAIYRQVGIRVSRLKLEPPYKSSWPKRVPSEKTLKKRARLDSERSEELSGLWSIWSSVMYHSGHLADFGNYILNSAVQDWSGRRIGKRDTNYKDLLEQFLEGLNTHQRELYEKAVNLFYGYDYSDIAINFVTYSEEGERTRKKQELSDKALRSKRLVVFLDSLPTEKAEYFRKRISPKLNTRLQIVDPLDTFDTGLAQRWLFNRVLQLGWTPELHGVFDKNINYYGHSRSEHKAERIGKKYQWIAFQQLLAKLSDNFELKKDSRNAQTVNYLGAWQLGVRDIDPTCTLKNSGRYRGELNHFVDSKRIKKLYEIDKPSVSNSDWLKNVSDLPDPKDIIEVRDNNGEEWLVLEGNYDWEQDTPPEFEKHSMPHRRLWYMARSYLVNEKDKQKVYRWAKKQNFTGRWMPESGEFYSIFLGEYPHACAFLDQYTPYYGRPEWVSSADNPKIPARVLVTDDEYRSSGSDRDCSSEESISVKLPAKLIVDAMKLKQLYHDGRFFNDAEELVAYDPQIFDKEGFNQLLVKKRIFLEFLNTHNYSLVWTVIGEKMIIGESGRPEGWMETDGAYTIGAQNKLIGQINATYRKPLKR